MNKKFFTSRYLLKLIFIFTLLSIICGVLFFALKDISSDLSEILKIFTILIGSCTIFLLTILFFHCWIVEINEQGILYKNLFKFRKFERFFRWEEIDEIEVIKIEFLNLKQIYFTRRTFSYGHKRFINMKKEPDVIILSTANKKIQKEIQKYYSKNIITGRNFKIAIIQENHEEQEK